MLERGGTGKGEERTCDDTDHGPEASSVVRGRRLGQ